MKYFFGNLGKGIKLLKLNGEIVESHSKSRCFLGVVKVQKWNYNKFKIYN